MIRENAGGASGWCSPTLSDRAVTRPLLMVEIIDVVFAVDSIPAIFAITSDPFIVFTLNIFAILGLRSLFFLLAGFVDRFRYLKVGLASVLAFVGAKMTLVDLYRVPPLASLCVITLLLGGSIAASLLASRRGTPLLIAPTEAPTTKSACTP